MLAEDREHCKWTYERSETWSTKIVAALVRLFVGRPFNWATNPAVDDSNLSAETHWPGMVAGKIRPGWALVCHRRRHCFP